MPFYPCRVGGGERQCEYSRVVLSRSERIEEYKLSSRRKRNLHHV